MIWAALTVIACFFICWNNPKNFWYVPLICNVFTPLAAIMDDTFWTTPFWIIMIIGFCLSFVSGFIGAKIGQKAAKQGTLHEESQMKE